MASPSTCRGRTGSSASSKRSGRRWAEGAVCCCPLSPWEGPRQAPLWFRVYGLGFELLLSLTRLDFRLLKVNGGSLLDFSDWGLGFRVRV